MEIQLQGLQDKTTEQTYQQKLVPITGDSTGVERGTIEDK